MSENHLVLFPDPDMTHGIWGVPTSTDATNPQIPLGISASLARRLNRWIGDWRAHFHTSGPPERNQRWSPDFDVNRWIEEGDTVALVLQEETGYVVERLYRSYADNPRQR